MNWFVDLGTRSKLLIGFGLMIMFLVGVITTSYRGIATIQASQRSLYQLEFANAVDLMKLRANENGVRAALLNMMAVTSDGARESWRREIRVRSDEVEASLRDLLHRNRGDQSLVARVEEFKSIRDAFAGTRDGEIIPLIDAGDTEPAHALAVGIQQERYLGMRDIAQALGDDAVERAREAVMDSERLSAGIARLLLVLGLAALAIAVVLVYVLNRLIAVPLRTLSGTAGKVAGGDLTVDVPVDARADEVGELLRAFGDMVTKLRKATSDLHEGVTILTTSSSEILATTTQVAAGATQTASAVTETTATVEEVKQTAQLASQKARHVSDSAQRVSEISQSGRNAVEQAIAGMHRIQEQMESIADSIVRLSEQGQTIGEIITTVNDLAEQSNVLSVNAAIEASRAGEHGKGFAVVAQEVKSLAEQSKQATAQVRTILGDIQKATSAAVLAAEQGHKAVEAGVKQSAEAGDSIRQLAESIGEAARAATQIAASSQQQMAGMDQIATAMENIRQASTQNVAGTRQAETAARNLNNLGATLKDLAEQYRV